MVLPDQIDGAFGSLIIPNNKDIKTKIALAKFKRKIINLTIYQ